MKNTDPAPTTPRPWRRYVLVGGAILLAVGVFYLFFWQRIRIESWINALNSDKPEMLREMRRRLAEEPDPRVNDALRSALEDDGRTFAVRTMVAKLLIERNRSGWVEASLRTGSLGTRAAALSVLADQPNYRTEIFPGPEYRVKETLVEWIDRRLDGVDRAVQLAILGKVEEAVPGVRALLDRSALEGLAPSVCLQALLASMRAVVDLKDCPSVPRLADLARDPEPIIRENALRNLKLAVADEGAPCPDAVTPEQVRAAVEGALGDPESSVRVAALLLLNHSSWITPVRDRVWALVDSDDNETVRRFALMALATAKDGALEERLPRLVHDRHPQVRAQAAGALLQIEDRAVELPALRGLLVGILGRETTSRDAFDVALIELRKMAKDDFIGFPDDVRLESIRAAEGGDNGYLGRLFGEMFHRGEAKGIARDAWARAWFVWFARKVGLGEEEADRAAVSREEYWKALDRGDEKAARAAIAPFEAVHPGLFLYEKGRLP